MLTIKCKVVCKAVGQRQHFNSKKLIKVDILIGKNKLDTYFTQNKSILVRSKA